MKKKSLFYRVMHGYDQLWRRWHKVEKVDQLLSLSLETYSGARRKMNDGTWIDNGDCLAILHFNHECFSQETSSTRASLRAALRFRRLLLESLGNLSTRIKNDVRLGEVKALYGVTWFPPHGEKVGFMIERLPDSLLNRMRRFYFRLLLKVFFPALAARESDRLQPHGFWMTRQNLLSYQSGQSGQSGHSGQSGNESREYEQELPDGC